MLRKQITKRVSNKGAEKQKGFKNGHSSAAATSFCNVYLESGDSVLIPRVGYAHRVCTEESFQGINIAPRARQQPIRLVPAFNGISHHQRDAEATRPNLTLTHQQPQPPLPTRSRTTAPSSRRRGGVGQGCGPDEEPDRRTGDASRVPSPTCKDFGWPCAMADAVWLDDH
jgi:hypothetical protein